VNDDKPPTARGSRSDPASPFRPGSGSAPVVPPMSGATTGWSGGPSRAVLAGTTAALLIVGGLGGLGGSALGQATAGGDDTDVSVARGGVPDQGDPDLDGEQTVPDDASNDDGSADGATA
jgi:hypothetical protein